MDKILHDPKDPKLWELWYIPYYGSCRTLSINRISKRSRQPRHPHRPGRELCDGLGLELLGGSWDLVTRVIIKVTVLISTYNPT